MLENNLMKAKKQNKNNKEQLLKYKKMLQEESQNLDITPKDNIDKVVFNSERKLIKTNKSF